MSLHSIYDQRVFDDATDDAWRTRVYVRSGELGLQPRADVVLMEALIDEGGPRRIQIVGPSGAGKTSLILRVIADLAQRQLEMAHEVLVLRVGDRPESLASPEAAMKLVLDTIATQGHRFANVDEDVLRDASADQRTRTPTEIRHQAGVNAQLVSYSTNIRQAFETVGFAQNSARVRSDLEDVIRQVREAGYRPALVLDDTEKFVSPGPDGELDVNSIDNLYHHGVRSLGELDVDLIVATHPRFEEVGRVREVSERLAMERIDVPELPADSDDPALRRILERRLERSEVDGELDSLIAPGAIEELQVLYHDRNRDMRSVLKIAHDAARHAVDRAADMIEPRDVRTVVARSAR